MENVEPSPRASLEKETNETDKSSKEQLDLDEHSKVKKVSSLYENYNKSGNSITLSNSIDVVPKGTIIGSTRKPVKPTYAQFEEYAKSVGLVSSTPPTISKVSARRSMMAQSTGNVNNFNTVSNATNHQFKTAIVNKQLFTQAKKEMFEPKSMREAANNFEINAVEFVSSVNKSVLENQTRPKGLPLLPISANGKKIWESLRFIVSYLAFESEQQLSAADLSSDIQSWKHQSKEVLSRIIKTFSEHVEKSSETGTVDLSVVTAATTNNGMARKLVMAALTQKLSNDSNAVRSLGIQMKALLNSIATKSERSKAVLTPIVNELSESPSSSQGPNTPDPALKLSDIDMKKMAKKEKEEKKKKLKEEKELAKKREKEEKQKAKALKRGSFTVEDCTHLLERKINDQLLQLTVLCKSFLEAMNLLLNDVETLKYIQSQDKKEERSLKGTVKDAVKSWLTKGDNSSTAPSTATPQPTDVEESILEEEIDLTQDLSLGTLDELVYKLVGVHNNEYTQAFITTYRSFSAPQILFQKIKAWHKRTASMPKEKADAIQVKIVITLKYWIEAQIDDFDEDLLHKLHTFIEEQSKDGSQRYQPLKNVIKKKTAEREEKTRLMLKAPEPILLPSNGLNLTDILYMSDPLTIAQQLTLIDHTLYKNIKVTELLNQSWNSPKLKHRSPNVVSMISRSTKLSFWVGSSLLYYSLDQRVKFLEKIIDICGHLLQLNNFNTLMSMLGALNLSAIHRLKATKSMLPADKHKILEKMGEIMSTDKSYQNYRQALKNAIPPAIPYLGIVLTDLTFIETGNQDVIQDKINFRKREQIYKAIKEVTLFQNNQYPFTPQEPVHALLQELPHNSNESELYSLSLFFEPREPNK